MKKKCVAKILPAISENFLCESNSNYNSYKCSYKLVFIPLSFSRKRQKQESVFEQDDGLTIKDISVFGL